MLTTLDLAPIIAHNSALAHPLFVALLTQSFGPNENVLPSPCLDVLPFLPPTLPSFDLMGRLLRDPTPCSANGYTIVRQLVRSEVLGRFLRESINWVDRAEAQEREGLISDDRFAKGVQNVGFLSVSILM